MCWNCKLNNFIVHFQKNKLIQWSVATWNAATMRWDRSHTDKIHTDKKKNTHQILKT